MTYEMPERDLNPPEELLSPMQQRQRDRQERDEEIEREFEAGTAYVEACKEIFGWKPNVGGYHKGNAEKLTEYAQSYSDIYLTPAMIEAVSDGEALVLLELVQKELKSNIKHDIETEYGVTINERN